MSPVGAKAIFPSERTAPVGASQQGAGARHRSARADRKLELRGISLPILIRFAEISSTAWAKCTRPSKRHRRAQLQGRLPLRVSDQGESAAAGGGGGLQVRPPYHFGLEAGSKPELLAVLAVADNETPIICNGFKDDEYIEMVMLAKKIGRQIIPVVEKYTELDLIVKHSQRVGVRPTIGCAEAGEPKARDAGNRPAVIAPSSASR
jgi:arginine decarboxylase-like protein